MLGSDGHASNPVKRKPKGLQLTPKKAPRNHPTGGDKACKMRHGKDAHLRRYDERYGCHEPESIKTLMKNGNAEREIEKELLNVATPFNDFQSTTYQLKDQIAMKD
jgi:hypothetical protein